MSSIVSPDSAPDSSVAGRLKGSGGVSADGACTYSIPLWVPPGRGGMTPSLALDYNSRRGNGLLGLGWILTGFSQIVRCPRTFVQDGEPREIMFDTSDRFALDGNRLILVEDENGSHAYGADGAEYRTEQDLHAKVTSAECDQYGPGAFLVHSKDGRILTYGAHIEGNRVSTVPSSYGGSGSYTSNAHGFQFVRYGWALSKIEDRCGNFITIDYDLEEINLGTLGYGYELRPTAVVYTASMLPGSPLPTRRIDFNYFKAGRPDVTEAYTSGFCRILAHLLGTIDIIYQPTHGSLNSLLYRYTLQYGQGVDTNRSRLVQITCQDGNAFSLGSTNIEWSDATVSFWDSIANGLDSGGMLAVFGATTGVSGSEGGPWIMTGDFTGTGTWNIMCGVDPPYEPDNPQSYIPPSSQRYADLDGDGEHEGLAVNLIGDVPAGSGVVSGQIYVAEFTMAGRSIAEPPAFSPPLMCAVDLIGNGLPEVVILNALGSWEDGSPPTLQLVDVWRLDSRGQPTKVPPPARPWSMSGSLGFSVSGPGPFGYVSPVCVDINGSGKNCLVWGQTILSHGQDTPSVNINLSAGVLADLNGDGLQDFVTLTGQGQLAVFINTGNGFIEAATVLMPAPYDSSPSFAAPAGPIEFQINLDGVRTLDIDNDGQDELLVMSGFQPSNTLFYLKWTGTTLECHPLAIPAGLSSGAASNLNLFSLGQWRCSQVFKGLVDGNGNLLYNGATDGLPGFVQVVNNNLHVYHQKGTKPDLVTKITDGFGAFEAFSYYPICNPNLYTAMAKSHYPIRILTGGIWVVNVHEISNGMGVRTFEYTYSSAMVDVAGWGWLGFENRNEYDLLREATTETIYASKKRFEKWYPYVGMAAKETTTTDLSDSLQRIQCSNYRYESYDGESHRTYFPYLAELKTRISERTSEGFTNSLFEVATASKVDSYGNILERSTDTYACKDGKPVGRPARRIVSTSYDNFPVTWLVGQARQIERRSITRSGKSDARATAYRYSPDSGLLSEIITAPDSKANHGTSQLVIRVFRDAYGLVTEVLKSGSGQERATTIQYEATERIFPSSITNALGQSTQQTYDLSLGLLTLSVDPNGCAKTFIYDTFRRLMEFTYSDGTDIQFHYLGLWAGSFPLSVTMDREGGLSSQVNYDELGRPVQRNWQRFDGTTVYSNVTYDNLGRVSAVSLPAAASEPTVDQSLIWDNLDRVLSVQKGTLPPTTYIYKGLSVRRSDPQGNEIILKCNALGHVVELIETISDGSASSSGYSGYEISEGSKLITKYRYGPFGRLAKVIDPLGHHVIEFDYDSRGRVARVSNADSRTTSITLNAFGETVKREDAMGSIVDYTLDRLGRCTAMKNGASLWTLQWDTSPNGIGALALTTNPSGSTAAYSYDSASRVISVTQSIQGQSYTAGYAYNRFGRLLQVTYPSADSSTFAVGYSYNALGYLEGCTDANGAWLWQCLDRDSLGNLTSEQFANAVTGTRTYTPVGWTQSIEVNGPNGLISSINYIYDNNGNVLNRESVSPNYATVNEKFTYDSLNRLVDWANGKSAVEYVYDPVGNIIGVNFTSGFNPGPTSNNYGENGAGEHALTTAINTPASGGAPSTQSFGYDRDGNQTSNPNGTDQFTWFGLPNSINQTGGAGSASFEYDTLQNRIAKRGTGWSTIYFPDLYELRNSSSGSQQVYYVRIADRWLLQVLRPLTLGGSGTSTSAPQVLCLHDDDLGSIVAVSAAGGAPLGAFSYEPFGERSVAWQATGSPPLAEIVTKGFTGHEHDDEVGLINMRGRMYDPTIRRFISPDPYISNPLSSQGYNLYSYVMNNPLSLTDPSGFQDDGDDDDDDVAWPRFPAGWIDVPNPQFQALPTPSQDTPSTLGAAPAKQGPAKALAPPATRAPQPSKASNAPSADSTGMHAPAPPSAPAPPPARLVPDFPDPRLFETYIDPNLVPPPYPAIGPAPPEPRHLSEEQIEQTFKGQIPDKTSPLEQVLQAIGTALEALSKAEKNIQEMQDRTKPQSQTPGAEGDPPVRRNPGVPDFKYDSTPKLPIFNEFDPEPGEVAP